MAHVAWVEEDQPNPLFIDEEEEEEEVGRLLKLTAEAGQLVKVAFGLIGFSFFL